MTCISIMQAKLHLRALGLAGLVTLGLGLPALAQTGQTADPAGTAIGQNQERLQQFNVETTPNQTGAPILTEPVPRADLPDAGGPTIALTSVVFEPPSAFLDAKELLAISAQYVGRTIDFAQISELVRAVNDLYAEKGVVTASAILPPQTLEGGRLVVQLVEGQLGAVSIVGPRRTADGFILDRVGFTRGGNVVDVIRAGQDISRFNALNSAQLRMLLEPGSGFGLTDLSIGVTEPPPHVLQISFDNHGSAATGEAQLGANYRAYGLAGIDDTFAVGTSASLGSTAITLDYDASIHPSGTRMSASVSASQIQVINGVAAGLGVTGGSQSLGLGVRQPIFYADGLVVSATGAVSYRGSQSNIGTVVLADTRTYQANVGVELAYSDDRLSLNLHPKITSVSFGNNLASTNRSLTLLELNAGLSYALDENWVVVVRGAGQHSPEPFLPGNLLFEIGGVSSVRGYPSAGVGGDSGYFVQAELRTSLNNVLEGLSGYVFTDFGEVFSAFPERTTLLSVGAGARYNWNNRVSLDLSIGLPVQDAVIDQGNFAIYSRLTGTIF